MPISTAPTGNAASIYKASASVKYPTVIPTGPKSADPEISIQSLSNNPGFPDPYVPSFVGKE